MSDYCGECDYYGTMGCPATSHVFPEHVACYTFSAKKRTCGECVEAYWKGENGLCCLDPLAQHCASGYHAKFRESVACVNFKGEAE